MQYSYWLEYPVYLVMTILCILALTKALWLPIPACTIKLQEYIYKYFIKNVSSIYLIYLI